MKHPLALDVCRCLGWDCRDKNRCQRHLSIAIDKTYDDSARSYTSSLRLPDEKTCPYILEDKE